jgi:mono/diheme cytochrome c family protein
MTRQENEIMGKREWGGLVTAAAVVALTACGDAQRDRPADTAPATPGAPASQVGVGVDLPEGVTLADVQAGEQVFQQQICFTCHGPDGTGTPLGPNLRDSEWLNTDGSFDGIVEVVRNGVAQPVRYPGTMPPMGGAQLSEEQIRQVSAYVYAIGHGG